MSGTGGLSDRDLILSTGNAWTQGLGLLLVVIGIGSCTWYALHGGRTPLTLANCLRTIWRRGRAYRQQMRAARHRRSRATRRHLTFRSPVR